MTFPVRDQYAIPDDVAYLNAAYQGPLAHSTVAAGQAALARKAEPWTITPADFFTNVQHYRELVAGLLGTDHDAIAVTPSISYGMATAAANVSVEPGEEIVVLADQFPSNVYVWRALAERREAFVHTVERPEDDDWTAALLDHLDRNGDLVAVVAVPNCHWTDGTRIDLVAVGARCRAIGAALVVDTAQSFGALPVNVAEVQPDFLAGVTYKWVLGPYSVGFLYVAPQRRGGTPLEQNWIARAHSDDFARLIDYADDYQPGARRYDMGEVSNFALLPAAIDALARLTTWGIANVATHAGTITDRIVAGAADLGYTVAPAAVRSSHLIGLRRPGLDAERLAATMAEDRVHVSIRGDSVRVSAHVFNTEDDADRLLGALARAAR